MQLDAETLTKLAAYGTNLEAPEGERLEDIQQARRAKLAEQINELKDRIAAIRKEARQVAQEHDQYLSEARRGILNQEGWTDLDKRYALRDLNQYSLTSSEVFDRELRPVRTLERQLRTLERQLENEN